MISRRVRVWWGLVCLILGLGVWGRGQSAPSVGTPAQVNSQATTQTTVPHLIKFSGILQDLSGKPMTGPVDVTFSLYSEQAGGSPLWFETQTVQADSLGRYTALLGAMTPAGVPIELFTAGEARWLGVQVSNLPEQPRVLLVSVPYAIKAGDAETLGGRPASEYQLTQAAETSSKIRVRRGTTTTDRGTSSDTSTSRDATTQAISTSGTANYIAGWSADGATLGTSAIFQYPVTNNIGIGTERPVYGLDVNNNAIGVGTKTAKPGFGGTLRFRDDTATTRWLVGLPGNPGATRFHISELVDPHEILAIESGAPYDALYINSLGQVGLGTNAPAYALDVTGNAIGVGTQTPQPGFGGNLRLRDDTGTPRWLLGLQGMPGATDFNVADMVNHSKPLIVQAGSPSGTLVIHASGNVGIGTAAPTVKLEVKGDTKINGTMTATKFVGDGSGLTAIGVFGVDDIFIGQVSGNLTTSGIHNTAVGNGTLSKITAGYGNTATGYLALVQDTTGHLNTASGAWALAANDTGMRNTAVGECALGNTSGTGTEMLACEGFQTLTAGSGNTGAGTWAGRANTTGLLNTFLGNDADTAAGNLTNATAIGANALVSASNALVLGSISGVNGAIASVNVGIGTTTPTERLEVNGNLKITGAGNAIIFPDGTVQSTAGTGTGGGGGTITGVTAGTGLSGGGTAGNVTLSLAIGNVNGVKEFTASGPFTVPPGITHLMVEMWGAGGGGDFSSTCGTGTVGGSGGGGAYTRDVIAVDPGATYTIVVGVGGVASGKGGDSQILDASSSILIFAGGGYPGTETAGGAGGQADTNAAISHPGNPGIIRSTPSFGGSAYAYNLIPNMMYGTGGEGVCNSSLLGGEGGYVLLTW
jgi:Glycine-rich domain